MSSAAAPVTVPPGPAAPATGVPPAPVAAKRTGYPYEAQPRAAGYLFATGLLVIFGSAIASTLLKIQLAFSGGAIAATAGFLFVIALILQSPALIMDDSPEQGGEPSTMRIMALAIVLVFCALTLKSGWDKGSLPTLDSTWVGLVITALGGKAVQKFAEIKDDNSGK